MSKNGILPLEDDQALVWALLDLLDTLAEIAVNAPAESPKADRASRANVKVLRQPKPTTDLVSDRTGHSRASRE